ncbi:MAG: creatininase family protein [Candidatus Thermoplasmatota archaeon]|nr:creatininase family protein [Candidatus Thermoplasmatota archaeon]
MFLDEIDSKSFAKMIGKNPVVILPIGATEAHGAHLPLGTDCIQPEYVAEKLAEVSKLPILIAPPLRYGECSSTRNFPGTISLSFDSLRSVIFDIISEFCRNGIKRVVVLSGHAGSAHMTALRLAAKEAATKNKKLKIMVLSDYDLAYELLDKQDIPKDDGHGGMIETSRILAIAPELAKKPEKPEFKREIPRFAVVADPENYWDGIRGYPGKASAEKGKEVNEYIVKRLAEVVGDYFS